MCSGLLTTGSVWNKYWYYKFDNLDNFKFFLSVPSVERGNVNIIIQIYTLAQ